VRIDLISERNTLCRSWVIRWGKSQFVSIKPVQQYEERHEYLHGKPSQFESGEYRALFICED
jgi:hypothetical protein